MSFKLALANDLVSRRRRRSPPVPLALKWLIPTDRRLILPVEENLNRFKADFEVLSFIILFLLRLNQYSQPAGKSFNWVVSAKGLGD